MSCAGSSARSCCLVLRHRDRRPGEAPEREVFRAPSWTPWLGAVTAAFLVGPWARAAEDHIQYRIAGVLLAIGVVLWLLTWLTNRGVRAKRTGFRDIDHLEQ